jgi:hypothetical protein
MGDGSIQTEAVTISDTLTIVRIALAIQTGASPLRNAYEALALLACSPSPLDRFGQSRCKLIRRVLNSLLISKGLRRGVKMIGAVWVMRAKSRLTHYHGQRHGLD